MSDEIKDIMKQGVADKQELSPELRAKLEEVKELIMDKIYTLKISYENKIPFSVLHQETNLDYGLISDVILALIMEKKLLGFINDGGTDAHDDDVLILRDSRYIDTLEVDYETGYAE